MKQLLSQLVNARTQSAQKQQDQLNKNNLFNPFSSFKVQGNDSNNENISNQPERERSINLPFQNASVKFQSPNDFLQKPASKNYQSENRSYMLNKQSLSKHQAEIEFTLGTQRFAQNDQNIPNYSPQQLIEERVSSQQSQRIINNIVNENKILKQQVELLTSIIQRDSKYSPSKQQLSQSKINSNNNNKITYCQTNNTGEQFNNSQYMIKAQKLQQQELLHQQQISLEIKQQSDSFLQKHQNQNIIKPEKSGQYTEDFLSQTSVSDFEVDVFNVSQQKHNNELLRKPRQNNPSQKHCLSDIKVFDHSQNRRFKISKLENKSNKASSIISNYDTFFQSKQAIDSVNSTTLINLKPTKQQQQYAINQNEIQIQQDFNDAYQNFQNSSLLQEEQVDLFSRNNNVDFNDSIAQSRSYCDSVISIEDSNTLSNMLSQRVEIFHEQKASQQDPSFKSPFDKFNQQQQKDRQNALNLNLFDYQQSDLNAKSNKQEYEYHPNIIQNVTQNVAPSQLSFSQELINLQSCEQEIDDCQSSSDSRLNSKFIENLSFQINDTIIWNENYQDNQQNPQIHINNKNQQQKNINNQDQKILSIKNDNLKEDDSQISHIIQQEESICKSFLQDTQRIESSSQDYDNQAKRLEAAHRFIMNENSYLLSKDNVSQLHSPYKNKENLSFVKRMVGASPSTVQAKQKNLEKSSHNNLSSSIMSSAFDETSMNERTQKVYDLNEKMKKQNKIVLSNSLIQYQAPYYQRQVSDLQGIMNTDQPLKDQAFLKESKIQNIEIKQLKHRSKSQNLHYYKNNPTILNPNQQFILKLELLDQLTFPQWMSKEDKERNLVELNKKLIGKQLIQSIQQSFIEERQQQDCLMPSLKVENTKQAIQKRQCDKEEEEIIDITSENSFFIQEQEIKQSQEQSALVQEAIQQENQQINEQKFFQENAAIKADNSFQYLDTIMSQKDLRSKLAQDKQQKSMSVIDLQSAKIFNKSNNHQDGSRGLDTNYSVCEVKKSVISSGATNTKSRYSKLAEGLKQQRLIQESFVEDQPMSIQELSSYQINQQQLQINKQINDNSYYKSVNRDEYLETPSPRILNNDIKTVFHPEKLIDINFISGCQKQDQSSQLDLADSKNMEIQNKVDQQIDSDQEIQNSTQIEGNKQYQIQEIEIQEQKLVIDEGYPYKNLLDQEYSNSNGRDSQNAEKNNQSYTDDKNVINSNQSSQRSSLKEIQAVLNSSQHQQYQIQSSPKIQEQNFSQKSQLLDFQNLDEEEKEIIKLIKENKYRRIPCTNRVTVKNSNYIQEQPSEEDYESQPSRQPSIDYRVIKHQSNSSQFSVSNVNMIESQIFSQDKQKVVLETQTSSEPEQQQQAPIQYAQNSSINNSLDLEYYKSSAYQLIPRKREISIIYEDSPQNDSEQKRKQYKELNDSYLSASLNKQQQRLIKLVTPRKDKVKVDFNSNKAGTPIRKRNNVPQNMTIQSIINNNLSVLQTKNMQSPIIQANQTTQDNNFTSTQNQFSIKKPPLILNKFNQRRFSDVVDKTDKLEQAKERRQQLEKEKIAKVTAKFEKKLQKIEYIKQNNSLSRHPQDNKFQSSFNKQSQQNSLSKLHISLQNNSKIEVLEQSSINQSPDKQVNSNINLSISNSIQKIQKSIKSSAKLNDSSQQQQKDYDNIQNQKSLRHRRNNSHSLQNTQIIKSQNDKLGQQLSSFQQNEAITSARNIIKEVCELLQINKGDQLENKNKEELMKAQNDQQKRQETQIKNIKRRNMRLAQERIKQNSQRNSVKVMEETQESYSISNMNTNDTQNGRRQSFKIVLKPTQKMNDSYTEDQFMNKLSPELSVRNSQQYSSEHQSQIKISDDLLAISPFAQDMMEAEKPILTNRQLEFFQNLTKYYRRKVHLKKTKLQQ